MDDLTRRDFLKRGSVGVAAGAIVLGAGSTLANAVAANAEERNASGTKGADQTATTSEPIVAYVRRGAHGEVRLMVGELEVVQHDADLARRIIRAADR
jgi:anaerobic selenocysteine-containing dehydrogenase